jgi:hypothetical protein
MNASATIVVPLLRQAWPRVSSSQAGGLAARLVNILLKDASLPRGSTRSSRGAAPQFRERTDMNNAG